MFCGWINHYYCSCVYRYESNQYSPNVSLMWSSAKLRLWCKGENFATFDQHFSMMTIHCDMQNVIFLVVNWTVLLPLVCLYYCKPINKYWLSAWYSRLEVWKNSVLQLNMSSWAGYTRCKMKPHCMHNPVGHDQQMWRKVVG